MLRALIFDFNGILVDDEPIHCRLFQQVLAEEGFALSEQDYYERYLGFDDRGVFRAVLELAGEEVAGPRLMRLIARKASYYRELIRREGYPFFPGAVELVQTSSEWGWMLGLVSGALREEVEEALHQANLSPLFKVLVTAEDVKQGKPDPEGYLLALEALNSRPPFPERLLHPHEIGAIEDSPAGLEAAAETGLLTLGIAHTYPARELAMADAVRENLEGLTPDEIETLLGGERGIS